LERITESNLGAISDAPIQQAMVFVPGAVILDSGSLHWSLGSPLKYRAAGTGILQRFIRLHRESEDEILKFAKDWGVFGLCEHHVPASWCQRAPCVEKKDLRGSFIHSKVLDYQEDVTTWRRFSAAADGVIQLAANPSRDPIELRKAVMPLLTAASAAARLDAITSQSKPKILRTVRGAVEAEIEVWLQLGAVGLRFEHHGAGWKISFAAKVFPNLLGILALKLIFNIAQAEGIAFCSTCHRAYLPGARRPSPRRRNYCETCKKDGTMWRDYKRLNREGAE
jgi:hypothetical protein